MFGIFVLYLIINMIVSESATNISVMKVLGFSRKEISNRVINVNHLLVCIGFLIGIPIAYGFVKVGYSDTIENYGMLLSPVLTAKTLVIGFVLTWVTYEITLATVYKGNIIKNLIMDCQSYTKYRPNETTGGIFVSWRRKEELPTGA